MLVKACRVVPVSMAGRDKFSRVQHGTNVMIASADVAAGGGQERIMCHIMQVFGGLDLEVRGHRLVDGVLFPLKERCLWSPLGSTTCMEWPVGLWGMGVPMAPLGAFHSCMPLPSQALHCCGGSHR